MNATQPSDGRRLPAVRTDAHGKRHVDLRAVVVLALPLFINSGIQALLNLTDTWFIGRLSTDATAAIGATYWFLIVAILFFGGTGLAVQTFAAQAYGAGDNRAAGRVAWAGMLGALLVAPAFVAIALLGPRLVGALGLAPHVEGMAVDFWFPRALGGVFAVGIWSVTGFFNGTGRTRVTLVVMSFVAVLNAGLNQLFIFGFGWGVAGAGWATTTALAAGNVLALWLIAGRAIDREYHTRASWRDAHRDLARLLRVGFPIGLFPAIDVTGLAMFQAMQASAGAIGGAATQIVMMLTSLAYLPTMGFALAGTTLVGQSIGAGDKDWAARVGNATIALAVGYMGLVTLFLALVGPWLLPLFVNPADPHAAQVIALGRTLLWFAAGYQIFDGLNLGAGFCLRGAGDMRVPTLALIVLSLCVFVPLTHMATFAPGGGWVGFLPQFGFGTVGAWAVALVYTCLLGSLLWLRWRSGAWRRISLG
ncbi:MAG TPA: MATE family efflux transporter [Burkholderiales bacterium]|jgi:MATE family multidrug resistance protein|nr:MATE family efflux transporter [Burkholderiales bacterium]